MILIETLRQLGARSREQMLARLVTPQIERYMERLPAPLGSFGYDPWGYNEDSAKFALAAGKWLYDHYFRVVAHGLEHVPAQGRVLIVGNHSGQLPMDGVLIGTALATNPHGPRIPRSMVERFFPTVPWVGNLLSAWGCVVGDPINCAQLLQREEAVIVFPEGVRGSGKPFRERYRLQRFGHGFMHLAIEHQAPIVPVGVVGCEESMPSIANLKPLAKLLGLPYFPLALSYLPLPARVYLNFGAPLRFSGPAGDAADLQRRVDEVRTAVERLVRLGLSQRKGIFG